MIDPRYDPDRVVPPLKDSLTTPVYIRHVVGRCPACSAPILDAGWTDDPRGWSHSQPTYNPPGKISHFIVYGACTMALSARLHGS